METAAVANLFAGLLFAGIAAVLVSLGVPRLRPLISRFGLLIAALAAVGATSGSLYFSEVANFNPCDMCWIQRIFMYPLALILPIAAVRRDRNVIPYAMVIAGVGLGFSIYHTQLQLMPDQSTSCDLLNPCSAKWVEALGFATIPMMAGTSFVLILLTLTTHLRSSK